MAEPHYNAANTHYRLEDYGQALGELEQALTSGESHENLNQSSFYNLGNTFFQSEEYETAIEAYKEALKVWLGGFHATGESQDGYIQRCVNPPDASR